MDGKPREIGVPGIDEKVGFFGNEDRGYLQQSGPASLQPDPTNLPQSR